MNSSALALRPAPLAGPVDLLEWQRRSSRDLGVAFFPSPAEEVLASSLSDAGILEISFLRTETRISARAHVGTIRIGGVTLRIKPKIEGAPLLRLVRFAYGLGDLKLHDALPHSTAVDGLLELVVAQLAAEVELLIRRGLRRGYVRREESLAAPRGRLDLRRLATQGPTEATLPCVHHPRSLDTPLHRVLRAGLDQAAVLTVDGALRSRIHRLRSHLDEVPEDCLELARVRQALTSLDRTTSDYASAMQLLELLALGLGVAQADQAASVAGRGFLFDMNHFFQRLLSRLLRENDAGLVIQDEHRLGTLMRYAPGSADAARLPPVPRPDFAVSQGGRILGLFDAKYRDLSEGAPPRELLYQLALYAQSREGGGAATMLYPSTRPRADRVIEVLDPAGTLARASIVMRAVDLVRLAELTAPGTVRAARAAFATNLLQPRYLRATGPTHQP